MFPRDSAFKQEEERRAAERQAHPLVRAIADDKDAVDEAQPVVVGKIESLASDDSLYYDLDRALSYLQGPGAVPQGSIRLAVEILERLRDEAYGRLR